MSQPLLNRKVLILNSILTLAVFVFFTWLLRDNVPLREDQDPLHALIWAGFTSACLSGVFWLASHMFSIVLIDSRRRREHGDN